MSNNDIVISTGDSNLEQNCDVCKKCSGINVSHNKSNKPKVSQNQNFIISQQPDWLFQISPKHTTKEPLLSEKKRANLTWKIRSVTEQIFLALTISS